MKLRTFESFKVNNIKKNTLLKLPSIVAKRNSFYKSNTITNQNYNATESGSSEKK